VQAEISAALLVGVDRQSGGDAPDRLLDALVGAGTAIVIFVLLFPIDPIRLIRDRARPIFETLDRGLREAVSASHRVVRDGGGPRPDLAEAVDGLAEALRSLHRWMERR
jgi:hypothetical protein